MAKTGPQRYPGASTAHWHQSTWGGSSMEVNVVVWHSTESRSLPSYQGGGNAPNFTAVPDFKNKRLVWYQHFDFDTSSRALRNLAGGVETNTANACQVEIVGTCDTKNSTTWRLGGRTYKAGVDYLFMGDLPSWAIRDLAAFVKWTHEAHTVRLDAPSLWKSYPSSYGTRAQNGIRMTNSQWRNFYGHCGHQHVPENDHGDPGEFPMEAILNLARGVTTGKEEVEVPLIPVDLGMTKTLSLQDQGVWVSLPWTDVWHGDVQPGNQAFTRERVRYNIVLDIEADGLTPGLGTIQARVVEDGRKLRPVEIIGTAGSSFGSVARINSTEGPAKIMVAWFDERAHSEGRAIKITRAELHGDLRPI